MQYPIRVSVSWFTSGVWGVVHDRLFAVACSCSYVLPAFYSNNNLTALKSRAGSNDTNFKLVSYIVAGIDPSFTSPKYGTCGHPLEDQ